MPILRIVNIEITIDHSKKYCTWSAYVNADGFHILDGHSITLLKSAGILGFVRHLNYMNMYMVLY